MRQSSAGISQSCANVKMACMMYQILFQISSFVEVPLVRCAKNLKFNPYETVKVMQLTSIQKKYEERGQARLIPHSVFYKGYLNNKPCCASDPSAFLSDQATCNYSRCHLGGSNLTQHSQVSLKKLAILKRTQYIKDVSLRFVQPKSECWHVLIKTTYEVFRGPAEIRTKWQAL